MIFPSSALRITIVAGSEARGKQDVILDIECETRRRAPPLPPRP